MTVVIRDPTWRSKLARRYRMARKADRKRRQQRERERQQYAAEYAAYEARQSKLIKREKIQRGRG
jgi:hypothetical protein